MCFHVKVAMQINKSKTSQTGALGEEIAATFLRRKGYKILERNYRKPWGEIDIIAEKGGQVHFIEVKAVSGGMEALSREKNTYRPEEMATDKKLYKVARTAALYMESKRDMREFQVDVLGVVMDREKRVARCRFFKQALD